MEENNIIFTCGQCYIHLTNFKEKDASIIVCMFNNSLEISNLLSFNSYGIINFEDPKHQTWNIKLIDSFNKKSTNAIVFNVKEDEYNNPYNYDKLVIYQNSTKNLENYGYVWIRTFDNHSSIHSYLEYLKDNVMKEIIKDISTWQNFLIYQMLNSNNKLTKIECDKIYKKYIEEYRWGGTYEEWKNSFKPRNQQFQTYSTY